MMLTAVGLLAYALTLATLGPALLSRARWVQRSPRLGVIAWQVLCATLLATTGLAGLLMLDLNGALAGSLIGLGTETEPVHVSTTIFCVALIALAAACCSAALIGVAGTLHRVRQGRIQHLRELAPVAEHHGSLNATVVPHPSAAAYCLGGREPTIVVTSGAIQVLDEAELAAVMAHEQAHLFGRHDVHLAVAAGLRSLLGVVPLFRIAHKEQARLLEMVADDAAAKNDGPNTVARAMVQMAAFATPGAALGAAGGDTVARVHRLLDPRAGISVFKRCGIAVALAGLAFAPLAIALAPSALGASAADCSISASRGHVH